MEPASINAFSVEPKDGFQNSNHSILFDHTLISGSDEASGITFRCGNIMALSAPSKGLPQEGGDGAKYMSFFLEHGEEITKAWFDEVNAKLTDISQNFPTPNNYKEINTLQNKEYAGIYQVLHDKLKKNLGQFLKTNIFENPKWGLEPDANKEIQTTLETYFCGKKTRNSAKYKEAGRIDKAYQLLFFNDLWQTQKFGGFDAGKLGPYGVFYDGLVNKEQRKMIGDAAVRLEKFINQSIEGVEGVDVLFLCESVDHLDKILGDNYTCVSIKKTEDEIYSAICKDSGITIETPQETVEGNAEFGIFTINKGGNSIKVAVVHTKEKVDKNEKKKVTGPNKDGWETFVQSLGDVNYMVGDTNMTAKKSKLTDNGDGSKKTFWESMESVEEAIVPERAIQKVRLGKAENSKVNGFLNNQINKGGDPTAEVDGMVILKLCGKKCKSKKRRDELLPVQGQAAATEAQEVSPQSTCKCVPQEKTGGGKRRRRKTKRKRKRKPKKKTKRKRKRKLKKKTRRKRKRKRRTKKR